MPKSDWRPTISRQVLETRAELHTGIRSFFARAGVLEVDTPLLGRTGVTDLHIDCIEARVCGDRRYLQSSPEYYMKRLLAAGSGPVFSLGKVFRDGEAGRRHRPEFTLLEWYRPGWDEFQLMTEIGALLDRLFDPPLEITRVSYREAFKSALGFNPHSAGLEQLRTAAGPEWHREERSTLLDLLFTRDVEPRLAAGLVFVHSYPACQAALAQFTTEENGDLVARRFELFINGMELGNGYFELTDAAEQRRRFEADIASRKREGKAQIPVDERLLAALEAGLPPCAGVALGVDRLLMQLIGAEDIAEVMPFPGG